MLDYKPKQHVCVELLQAVQQQAHSSPPVFFTSVYQNDDGLSLMLLQQGVLQGPVEVPGQAGEAGRGHEWIFRIKG